MVYLSPNSELPNTDKELNELGIKIDRHLRRICAAVIKTKTDQQSQFEQQDEYIFGSVQTFGALAFLSSFVLRTVHQWQFEYCGPEKLRRLGEELAKATELRRGIGNRGATTKGSVTQQHVLLKQQLVPELKSLQRRIDEACDWPTNTQQAISFLRSEIEHTANYPVLRVQLTSLMMFLENSPDVVVEFRNARHLARGSSESKVSAVQFFYAWLAYTLNLKPKFVRLALSRLH